MDDLYSINLAKSELREAYSAGDVERLLSVYHPAGFADMSHGAASAYGPAARERLRTNAASLFREYAVKFTPIAAKYVVRGDLAYSYGWNEFVLTPRDGGESVRRRDRYLEIWNKDASGAWKIAHQISNEDIPEELNAVKARWFLSEDNSPARAGV